MVRTSHGSNTAIQNIVTGIVILVLGGVGAYSFTMLIETVKKVSAIEISQARLTEQNRLMSISLDRIEKKVDNHMQASIIIQTPPASNQIRHN